MVIYRPTLPPREGYVEIERDGARQYQETPQRRAERIKAERKIADAQLARADMENLMCEMDAANEAAHAEYETALCDIDEALNGGN